MDSQFASHDKILMLLSDPSPKRWQAAFSWCAAIGWCADHGTDGHVPPVALPFVHGTPTTARLLVTYRLWEESLNGWQVVNYGERQELAAISAGKREAKRVAGEKGNCIRWHGPECWSGNGCSVA